MFHSKLVGLDLHAPSQYFVENRTGSTIPALKVVSLDGLGVNNPKIVLNDGVTHESFGITNTAIIDTQSGFVTSFGIMYGTVTQPINTVAWAVETHLYCSLTGDLTSTPNGSVVATVIVSDAVLGVLLVGAGVSVFSGASSDWSLTGNAGLGSHFLGTTDASPINLKTNNTQIGQFDQNGRFGLGAEAPLAHFYQKSGPGYTGSGIRQESLSVTTTDGLFNNIWSLTLSNAQTARVTIEVMGRQGDGTQRCLFKRTGLFYKQGGNVQIQGPTWASDNTMSSTPNFGVSFNMNVTDVNITVKNSSANTTYWVGKVEYQVLSSNL
jgi:hypothetical protein